MMNEEQRLFLEDAHQLVEKLHADLEMLHVAHIDGRRRRQLAAQIFRRVHTVKGSAASFRFKSANRIAHEFESVLDGVRLGRIDLTESALDTFDDAVDAISAALQTDPDEQFEGKFDSIINRLHVLATQHRRQGEIAGALRAALPAEISAALSEYDLQHAREAVREGARLFVVSAVFDIDTFDENFRELTKLLGQGGEVISTLPGIAPGDDEISFRLLYATELVSAELRRQAALLGRITESEIAIERNTAIPVATRARPELTTGSDPIIADTPLRVDSKQIDELISATGDLFRHTTSALAAITSRLGVDTINHLTHDLRPRFIDLEERLMKLRLVAVGDILERTATRAGRMAARQLGKQVEFEIIGGEVGIEKALAEVIADPLLHLVRNAITHGIEMPDQRRAAGKDPTGKVTLAASNHSGRVHITVTDDGRGIDIERVVAAAADQNISHAGLSMDQCLRLIFRPGFSTSTDVSDLSGRGIGLDVVDRAMDVAGGEVRVVTERGAGTTFAMIMPAMVSLVRCVLVECDEQVYAIDAAHVTEVTPEVQTITDESTRVINLGSLIGSVDGDRANAHAALLWKAPKRPTVNGTAAYLIGVDKIIAKQETLVRSLGRHAPRWAGVCGAAEVFDGRVALVLDLEELIRDWQDVN